MVNVTCSQFLLQILLIANSLEYTIKDSDYDDIDKLFPLEEN